MWNHCTCTGCTEDYVKGSVSNHFFYNIYSSLITITIHTILSLKMLFPGNIPGVKIVNRVTFFYQTSETITDGILSPLLHADKLEKL